MTRDRILNWNRRALRTQLLGAGIALYFLASMTWFFATPVELRIGFTIRLLMPVLVFLALRRFAPPPAANLLLCLYGLLAAYMLISVLYSEVPSVVLINTVKYLYVLTFFLALLLVLRPQNVTYKYVLGPVVFGICCAIQALVLFALITTNHAPPLHHVILVGYKDLDMPSYGVFGYAWGTIRAGSLHVYRAQSYFGEPTRMGAYMEFSTILSWGLYRFTQQKRWLVGAMICASALCISFSMTTYIVVFLSVILYLLITRWPKWGYAGPDVLFLASAVAITGVGIYIYSATSFYTKQLGFLNLGLGHADTEFTLRVDFLTNSLRLFRDHPFGIGVIGAETSKLLAIKYPGAGGLIAPLVWLVIGGITGLAIQLTAIVYVLKQLVIPHVRQGGIQRYIGLAFIAYILHQCVAGDWFDPLFFFLIASVVMLDRWGIGQQATDAALPISKG